MEKDCTIQFQDPCGETWIYSGYVNGRCFVDEEDGTPCWVVTNEEIPLKSGRRFFLHLPGETEGREFLPERVSPVRHEYIVRHPKAEE